MDKLYDVVIVGGSAAGLSAALFATRRNLKTVVITKDIGGQLSSTLDVENYPGIQYIEGFNLAVEMRNQAEAAGAKIIIDSVENIKQADKKDGLYFSIKTASNKINGKTVILAYGKTPRSLGIAGEKEFLGKGVSYCTGCDINKYSGQEVIIVGGGSAAFEGAKLAAKICSQVYLVHRNDKFRAEDITVKDVRSLANVKIITNAEVKEILGEKQVQAAVIKTENKTENNPKNNEQKIPTNAVFIEIGFEVNRSLTENLVKLDQQNQIIVNEKQETSIAGIFAAGDVTNIPYNQAIISAGEGAKAALSAYSFINEGKPFGADWGKV